VLRRGRLKEGEDDGKGGKVSPPGHGSSYALLFENGAGWFSAAQHSGGATLYILVRPRVPIEWWLPMVASSPIAAAGPEHHVLLMNGALLYFFFLRFAGCWVMCPNEYSSVMPRTWT
jgi:hypothetical protein